MHTLFTSDDIKRLFPVNNLTAKIALSLLKLNKINRLYEKLYPAEGVELIEKGINYLNISLKIDGYSSETFPKSGAFMTISNHAFGFLDGLTIMYLVGKERPGLKMTANFLMDQLKPLKKFFISVSPFEGKLYKSMGGTEAALKHLESGEPLGFFPSGQVAAWQKGQKGITERPWSEASVRLMKKAEVPVIPIFFHGHNSWSFHLLGRIHPMLRTLRIPAEFLKMKNKIVRVTIGDMVSVEEQQKFNNLQDYGTYIRSRLMRLEEK